MIPPEPTTGYRVSEIVTGPNVNTDYGPDEYAQAYQKFLSLRDEGKNVILWRMDRHGEDSNIGMHRTDVPDINKEPPVPA